MFPPTDSSAQNIGDYLVDWYSPTSGTTDVWFYNDTLNIGPPPLNQCTQNLKRFGLTCRTGSQCIGIANSISNSSVTNSGSYREYAQVRLMSPMQPGVIYRVEFYVRRSPEAGSVSNNVGAFFSTQAQRLIERNPRSYGQRLARVPQVNEIKVVADKRQWARISGCFRADSAYQYLTLGNFLSDGQTTYITDLNYGNQANLLYYLIDDVSVTPTSAAYLPPNITLGPDTTLCPTTTRTFQLPVLPGLRYRWQDGDSSSHFTVKRSGLYWVEANVGGCINTDSIRVSYKQSLTLPVDTIICDSEPYYLIPKGSDGPIRWNTGSNENAIVVSQSGLYWVKALSSVCALSDSIHIEVVSCPGEVPNVITPNGDDKNETLFIKNIEVIPWYLGIYNRWGKLVYETEAYRNDWNGHNLPAGVYYYYLSNNQLKRSLKGWVQILR